MKGVIFVEFLQMVDEELGMEATEELIEDSQLASGGVYTIVGTYPDDEMISLVVNLHKKTQIPISTLLRKFGAYLFERFVLRYSNMMEEFTSGFELLKRIDDYIHVEVAKLYPKAQLPKFEYEEIGEDMLRLIYKSERKLPDLAEGLITAAMSHFNEKHTIEQEFIEKDGSWVHFIITRED